MKTTTLKLQMKRPVLKYIALKITDNLITIYNQIQFFFCWRTIQLNRIFHELKIDKIEYNK